MSLWDAPKLLFKANKPTDLSEYIGRTVVVPEFADLDGKRTKMGEQRVIIKTICGNRWHRAFFEINGKHRIGMLRFYAQMNKDKSISEDEFHAFEDMTMEVEKLPEKEPNGKK